MLKCSHNKGFTLIELLVSVGILIMVVLISTGIYVYTVGGQQKNVVTVNLQQEGQYLLSMMSKDIRENCLDYDYYITTLPVPVYTLALANSYDSPQTYYAYRYNLPGRLVERCQKTSSRCTAASDFAPITMKDVKVDILSFYISPLTNPSTYGVAYAIPPRITTVLELRSLDRFGVRRLRLETMVMQRRVEKR